MACQLFHQGHSCRGNWTCHTHHCERTFRPTLIGFVRGVLSRQRHRWSRSGDEEVGFREAVGFLLEFLGLTLEGLRADSRATERRSFVARSETFARPAGQAGRPGWPRDAVRARLRVPSPYYRQRGYSTDILDRFDVGEPVGQGGPLAGRAVVPVHDSTGRRVVGFTARALADRCERCGLYHTDACPEDEVGRRHAAKWLNHSLERRRHLYGYWAARQAIRETGLVVLVEGPGCVWRLHEAGVAQAVALFGSSLADPQQVLLESSGALDVLALLDPDAAGADCGRDLKEKLGRSFRLHFVPLSGGDIGSMSVDRVVQEIVPRVRALERSET